MTIEIRIPHTAAGLPAHLTGPELVKQNPATGRWFITIGQAGFNTPANNGRGYATEAAALAAHRRRVCR